MKMDFLTLVRLSLTSVEKSNEITLQKSLRDLIRSRNKEKHTTDINETPFTSGKMDTPHHEHRCGDICARMIKNEQIITDVVVFIRE